MTEQPEDAGVEAIVPVEEIAAEPVEEPARETPDRPETGDPRVDEVLRSLDALRDLPTGEHVAVFDGVHRGLQDALANLDSGQ